MSDTDTEPQEGGLKSKIPGLAQELIGEIEKIGGALTGDPITQAEGQLNVDVGEIREGGPDEGAQAEKHRV